jgi:hypothetical protein
MKQTSAVSRRDNTVGQNSAVSWGDQWYTAHLVGSLQPGGKEGTWKIGVLGPLLNRRSSLSVRNDVLLYKQLIRSMMDYACPIWRSVARSHFRKLQVLQSKCLRITTSAPWYVINRQFSRIWGFHSSLTTSEHWRDFDSKLMSKTP